MVIALINEAINHFFQTLFSICLECKCSRLDVAHREFEEARKGHRQDFDNAEIEIDEGEIHAIEMTVILVVKKEKRA